MKKKDKCGALIENSKKEILLQLRDNNDKIKFPNKWGTFGGALEENENPLDSLKRELKEELNYEFTEAEYFGNFPFDSYSIFMYHILDNNKFFKTKKVNVFEGQRGEFFSFKKIRKLNCAFNCKEIVEAYYKKYHNK